MYAIQRGDIVDARALDEMEAEQCAIARRQRGRGVLDRLLIRSRYSAFA